jgi:hypothetical protein
VNLTGQYDLSRPWAEDLKANSSVGCVCKRLKREESGELELSTGCHARARSCDADVTTRLLMSTREDPDIVARLANYRNIYIGMDDNKLDIERFVTRELETAIRHGTLTVSSEFRKEIEDTLNARAQAM